MNAVRHSARQHCLPPLHAVIIAVFLSACLAHRVSAQPTNGLAAYWPLNGNANDGSGNGNNGTVNGPTSTTDRFGNGAGAYYFRGPGNTDVIDITWSSGINLDRSTGITMSVWLRTCGPFPGDYNGQGVMIGSTIWSICLEQYWDANFNRYNSNSGIGNGGTRLNDGRWHNLVIVLTDSVAFYIDGVFESKKKGEFWGVDDFKQPNGIAIGRGRCPSMGNNLLIYYRGALDDIRLYSRTLSGTEIQQLYTENGWSGYSPAVEASIDVDTLTETTICKGQDVKVRVAYRGDGLRWNTLNGVINPNDPVVTLRPEQTTTYYITSWRAVEGPPCADTSSATDTVTVVVNDAPIAQAGEAQYACGVEPKQLGGPSSGTYGGTPPYRWQWTPSTELDNPNIERPLATVTATRFYYLKVTDAGGCVGYDTVQVVLLPRPQIGIGPDTVYYCRGTGGIRIGAEARDGNPPYTYLWSPSAGLDRDDSSSVLASPSVTTTYKLSVADNFPCSMTDSITVIPVDPPTVKAGRDTTICLGGSATIGSDGLTGLEYQWTPVDGLTNPDSSNTEATPTETTLYYVTATDPGTNCFSTDSVLISVNDVQLSLDQLSLDFGLLGACASDSILILHLTNNGATTARLTSRSSQSPAFSLQESTLTIGAGETQELHIRYAPPGTGRHTGKMILQFEPCDVTLEIDLRGEIREAVVNLPSSIDFGRMLECEIREIDTVIVIDNGGTVDATVTKTDVAAPFEVTAPALPLVVPAGERREIHVRYVPSGSGVFSDDLVISYESGECKSELHASLRGEVVDVDLQTRDQTIDFGLLNGCTSEKDTVIYLVNASSEEIRLTSATLPRGYQVTSAIPAVVAANDSLAVSIRFRPQSNGVFDGEVVLKSEPCDRSLQIALHGEKQGVSFTHADTLDFGELVSCQGSDRTLPLSILYDGAGDGSVTSVTITGPFTTTLRSGSVLPSGSQQEYNVTFSPTGDGIASGLLTMQFDPCDIERTVVLKGRASTFDLTTVDYDFGIQPSGTTSSGDVLVVNSGSATVHVENVGGVAAPFTLVGTTPPLPADLAPGDTLHISIFYLARPGQSQSSVDVVTGEPCNVTVKGEVKGEGEIASRVIVDLPELSAVPGASVRLEPMLIEGAGLDEAGAHHWRAEIAFEKSLLTVTDGTAWREVNSERIVTIEGERVSSLNLNGGVELQATLGRVERTPLRLLSFEWIDVKREVETEKLDGEFVLEGLCREGGVRLFNPEGEVAIKRVVPNPGRGRIEVEYSLNESGKTELLLVNVEGKEVAVLFDGLFVPGVYRMSLESGVYSSGSYWLVLRTPTLQVTKRVEIVE